MDSQSPHSQVEQVQLLLQDLQKSLTSLAPEQLDGMDSSLRHLLHGIGWGPQSAVAQEEITPNALGEVDPWLGLAMRQAKCGAWKWDLVNRVVHWSPELYALLGYDPSRNITDPELFFEIVHPDERAAIYEKVKAAILRGGPFTIEFRTFHENGREMWILSTGTVEHDAAGRPIQAAGISQEITDRKAVEEALRASEERERAKAAELQTLMNAVPAIILISRDSMCREMVGNPTVYQYLKMEEGSNVSKTAEAEAIQKQPYKVLKNGQEIPIEAMPMQVAAATGIGTNDFDFELVFDGGVTRNLLGNIVPMLDASGKPSGAIGAFVDITERKRVEEELRLSEAQLRKWREQFNIWSQTTNSFFWILGPDGSYNNPSMVAPYFTGRTFEENRGMKWLEVFHPEDRDRVREQIETALREKTPFNIEARVWRKAAQEWNWYIHRAVPLYEEETVIGWIGASNNIQERKEVIWTLEQTQEALRKSEARERARAAELQAIINAVPSPILLVHKNGDRVITGNQMAYQFFRAQPGENLANYLYGQSDSHIVNRTYNDGKIGPEEIPLLLALRTGEPVRDFEGRIAFDDGSVVAIIGSATPLFNAAGETEGAVSIFMDISQKNAAEQALRESEQRFRVALASAPITVFSTDAQLRYNWVYNPRHNLLEEDIRGKRGDEILPPEDVAEFTRAKQEVIDRGKPVQREINIQINKEMLNYLVSLDPTFDQNGHVTGLVGSTLDITRQRRLEAERRENEMRMMIQRRLMDYGEKERVAIAREIHDGPIQTLVGMLFAMHGILLNITDSTIQAALEPLQESMKNAVQELRQVLNELRPPSLERFGLAKAVQKHAESVLEKCPELDLRLEIDSEIGGISEQASLAVYRVCQEALNNIARHSLATQASVILSSGTDGIRIEIQDNGMGFSGPVDFVGLSERNHFGMVGMKERVEALGGSFWISSQKNRGTRITVSIPSGCMSPANSVP